MTNYEKIIGMTVEEIADQLNKQNCNYCPCDEFDYKECYEDKCDCYGLILKWLNSEC